jgi:hypothetical protein
MAYLECCPADVEQSGEDCVEGVFRLGRIFVFIATEERDEAGDDQHQSADVPGLSLSDARVRFVRKQPDDGCGYAIADLSCEEGAGCCLRFYDLLEEEEEVVEPAGGHQIVDEVPHSIGPDLLLIHAVIAILRELPGGRVVTIDLL